MVCSKSSVKVYSNSTGKFIAVNTHTTKSNHKKKNTQKTLVLHLKEVEKEEQNKLQSSQKEENKKDHSRNK